MQSNFLSSLFGKSRHHPKQESKKLHHNFNGRNAQTTAQPPPKPTPFSKTYHKTDDFTKDLKLICNKLAETPEALDGLLFVITTLLNHPNERKYRSINTATPRYAATIGKSPIWSSRFLEVVSFSKVSNNPSMYRLQHEDKAKLWLAKSTLENIQKTSKMYIFQKEKLNFNDTVKLLIENQPEDILSNIPPEPVEGSAGTTTVRVHLGSADVSRRFSSDDTLRSLLNWLNAELTTQLSENLEQGHWEFVNLTYYPHRLIAIEATTQENNDKDEKGELDLSDIFGTAPKAVNVDKTLQALDLWPSCELLIQPKGFLQTEQSFNGIVASE